MILSVDLASKFSAAVLMDLTGQVRWQGDSGGLTAFQFADKLSKIGNRPEVTLIVIEDVPYGISSQAMVKPALRLQGALILAFRDSLEKVVFLNPSTWQKHFEGVHSGKGRTDQTRAEAARVAALTLGYEPPNLVQAYLDNLPEGVKPLKKYTNPLAKSMTDYVDAFLIAHWARTQGENIRALTGVQPPLI